MRDVSCGVIEMELEYDVLEQSQPIVLKDTCWLKRVEHTRNRKNVIKRMSEEDEADNGDTPLQNIWRISLSEELSPQMERSDQFAHNSSWQRGVGYTSVSPRNYQQENMPSAHRQHSRRNQNQRFIDHELYNSFDDQNDESSAISSDGDESRSGWDDVVAELEQVANRRRRRPVQPWNSMVRPGRTNSNKNTSFQRDQQVDSAHPRNVQFVSASQQRDLDDKDKELEAAQDGIQKAMQDTWITADLFNSYRPPKYGRNRR